MQRQSNMHPFVPERTQAVIVLLACRVLQGNREKRHQRRSEIAHGAWRDSCVECVCVCVAHPEAHAHGSTVDHDVCVVIVKDRGDVFCATATKHMSSLDSRPHSSPHTHTITHTTTHKYATDGDGGVPPGKALVQ
jgi:hypothetical protein